VKPSLDSTHRLQEQSRLSRRQLSVDGVGAGLQKSKEAESHLQRVGTI